jgi:hypothetical protein
MESAADGGILKSQFVISKAIESAAGGLPFGNPEGLVAPDLRYHFGTSRGEPSLSGPAESSTPLDRALAAYLWTQASRTHTQRAYVRHLRETLRALPASTPADLAPWRLQAWREEFLQDGRSPATHAQAISALRSFLDWLADQLGQDLPRAVLHFEGPQAQGHPPL